MDRHRRDGYDAYIVALAPAVVFLGVYAYERGRYYFLRVAPDFIDLSLNRLLAGGVVVGALSIALVGLTLWIWQYSASKGRSEKVFAAMLATIVFLALPIGLWLQALPKFSATSETVAAYGQALATLVAMFVSVTTVYQGRRAARHIKVHVRTYERAMRSAYDARADGVAASEIEGGKQKLGIGEALASTVPSVGNFESFLSRFPWKVVGGIALLLWTAAVFAGLGYRVERSYVHRLCRADSFVADVHGDSLILKGFDPTTGQILSPVKVVDLKGMDLDTCSPRLIGETGLVLWD
ncbi:hypothetical protein [Stenotrophomonas sp.]|uniref:hypothetical protein n=1 Tax=Stenotrophomonas sp. TaxID=69392 RepID=UPI0028978F50|nr:hypothetical protein [Stenotrophomonas sp.]